MKKLIGCCGCCGWPGVPCALTADVAHTVSATIVNEVLMVIDPPGFVIPSFLSFRAKRGTLIFPVEASIGTMKVPRFARDDNTLGLTHTLA
jgi:hypothetical protein